MIADCGLRIADYKKKPEFVLIFRNPKSEFRNCILQKVSNKYSTLLEFDPWIGVKHIRSNKFWQRLKDWRLKMMSLRNDRYSYRIIWSEEDKEYVGLCTEFPSLSWLDESPEDALRGIRRIIADVVMDMQRTGEEIPAPVLNYSHHKNHLQFVTQVA